MKNLPNLNRLKIVVVEQSQTGQWPGKQPGKSTCTVSQWCGNNLNLI